MSSVRPPRAFGTCSLTRANWHNGPGLRSSTVPGARSRWAIISFFESACGASLVAVRDMRPPRELTLDVGLPFGVINHEQIQITPIDAHSSRVTFT